MALPQTGPIQSRIDNSNILSFVSKSGVEEVATVLKMLFILGLGLKSCNPLRAAKLVLSSILS